MVDIRVDVPDFFGAMQRGVATGRATNEYTRGEENRKLGESLAPAIMGGDVAAYEQLAAKDKPRADEYQSEHVKRLKQLAAAGQYMKDALESKDPLRIQAAWTSGVRPLLGLIVKDKPIPEAWTDDMMPAMEQAMAMVAGVDTSADASSGQREFEAKARAAGLKPGTPEYKNAARIALGVNPRAVTGAVKFATETDRNGNPRPRRNYADGRSEVLDDNNEWVPLGTGGEGGPPQSADPPMAPGRLGTVSDSDPVAARLQAFSDRLQAMGLPPAQQQELMTAFEQQQDVVPVPDTGAPTAPMAAPSNAAVLGVGRTKEQEAAAVQQAERNVDVGTPALASGYRYKADGSGSQEFIPGGPQDPAVLAAQSGAKSDGGNKPLPVRALQFQLEAQEALNTTEILEKNLGGIISQIDDGTLDLSLGGNVEGGLRNYFGFSNPNSVNLATFKANLQKIRNDILIMHKGVQTEGDAKRAMDTILSNPNDEKVVRAQMERLRELNKLASKLQQQKLQTIDRNYGRTSNGDIDAPADDISDLLNKYGQP